MMEMKPSKAYLLVREMKQAGKRGLSYEQWCLETGREQTVPVPPLEESLADVYNDINKLK
jgi:hypothetical protein